MIPNTLIIPTEKPPSLSDIKRALLTHDKVYINSPLDRELIPPNSFEHVMTGFPLISGLTKSVRPLGKVPDFDEEFQKLLDVLGPAIRQESVIVRKNPVYNTNFVLGAVEVPPDLPDHRLVFAVFKTLVSNPQFVEDSIIGLDINFDEVDINQLAPQGIDVVNDRALGSPLRLKSFPNLSKKYKNTLSKIAWSRLGSLAKNLLICEREGFVPTTSDSGLCAVIQKIEMNGLSAVNEIEETEDKETIKRLNWLRQLFIKEYIDHEALENLSIEGLLRLRTKAWGKGNEARLLLNKQLKKTALDNLQLDDFKKYARKEIETYGKANEELNVQLTKLKTNVLIDLTGAIFPTTAGIVHKFLALGSIEATLLLGTVGFGFGLKFAKDNLSGFYDYLRKRDELKESSGYAFVQSYKPFIRK